MCTIPIFDPMKWEMLVSHAEACPAKLRESDTVFASPESSWTTTCLTGFLMRIGIMFHQ
jgi:hypothetical protein